MSNRVLRIASAANSDAALGIYLLLILANVAAWFWAFELSRYDSIFLGTALLAYTLGMRHAVDADHIAAIDNVTRKFVQEGTQSISVGFYFALGHSSVVAAMTAAIACATVALDRHAAILQNVGGIVSTIVSVLFLFTIALANLFSLRSIYRTYSRVQRESVELDGRIDEIAEQRGILARLLRPIFGLVTRGWHMFPVGVLFGLGFGTATEVTLVAISATQVAAGVSVWSMMVFPVLFAAAMSLIDTTDGVLMLRVYNWAILDPGRKLYYNLVLTFTSAAVAIVIGTIETLGLVMAQFQLDGWFWELIAGVNSNLGALGFVIIGFFFLSWLGAVVLYRRRGFGAPTQIGGKPV